MVAGSTPAVPKLKPKGGEAESMWYIPEFLIVLIHYDSYIRPAQSDYPQTGLLIAELACRHIVICDYG